MPETRTKYNAGQSQGQAGWILPKKSKQDKYPLRRLRARLQEERQAKQERQVGQSVQAVHRAVDNNIGRIFVAAQQSGRFFSSFIMHLSMRIAELLLQMTVIQVLCERALEQHLEFKL